MAVEGCDVVFGLRFYVAPIGIGVPCESAKYQDWVICIGRHARTNGCTSIRVNV